MAGKPDSWEDQASWACNDHGDSWHKGGKGDRKGGHGGRNSLEPKCISLLVNVYRYKDSNYYGDWHKVSQSADKLFTGRENIQRLVTSALTRDNKKW